MDYEYAELRQDFESGFNYFKDQIKKNHAGFGKLAEHQEPKYLIISCSDSRVCPSRVLNLEVGKAFMIRNVANMVPHFSKEVGGVGGVGAAIEYAVLKLKVKYIVIMGHSNCGGIKGLMKEEATGSFFLKEWLNIGSEAKIKSSKAENLSLSFDQKCTICEKLAIDTSLENLMSYPFVLDGVENKKLTLIGGFYDFSRTKMDEPIVSLKLWDMEQHSILSI